MHDPPLAQGSKPDDPPPLCSGPPPPLYFLTSPLGGLYYLSTQQELLPVFNTTNGSSHLISLTPLTAYHFPCELTFTTQQTGLGTFPHNITLHLPLLSSNSFRYIPWQNDDDDLLNLHYQSLNFTLSLQFDNQTLKSLDHTFSLLDGQLTSQIATIKQDLSHLHSVSSTTLNHRLTYLLSHSPC